VDELGQPAQKMVKWCSRIIIKKLMLDLYYKLFIFIYDVSVKKIKKACYRTGFFTIVYMKTA